MSKSGSTKSAPRHNQQNAACYFQTPSEAPADEEKQQQTNALGRLIRTVKLTRTSPRLAATSLNEKPRTKIRFNPQLFPLLPLRPLRPRRFPLSLIRGFPSSAR